MRGCLVLVTAVALACATRAPAASSRVAACDEQGRDFVTHYAAQPVLAAAFVRRADAVANWQEHLNEPDGPHVVRSRWRDYPPDAEVALCYYDGTFDNYSPPGPPGHRISGFDRALVFVGPDRVPVLDHIGTKATDPIVAP